jgi:cell division protein FtsW
MDLLALGIAIVLTFFGLAMIASVSVFKSYQLTAKLTGEGYNSFYLWRSFAHVITGTICMVSLSFVPYRLWERFAKQLFFLTIGLQVLLLVPGIGADWGTANSWLRLGPFSLQPSEFLKLTFIMYLSVWLQKREQLIGTFKEGFIPFVILLMTSTILVALEPNMGSFLIFSCIASVMFFIAGGSIVHLFLGGSLAAITGLPIILQKEYIRNRFVAFLFPNDPSIREGIGFQIKEALIAIGSGGFFGVGYGKSIQKFGYLPEVQADMIFSAMSEELGFFRLMIVLSLFAILVYRGFRIAKLAKDRFGFLLATGITTWIAVQAIVNISVNLGIFPLTGLTLPFISYGGSSLLSVLCGVGILLNISATSSEAATERRTRRSSLLTSRFSF